MRWRALHDVAELTLHTIPASGPRLAPPLPAHKMSDIGPEYHDLCVGIRDVSMDQQRSTASEAPAPAQKQPAQQAQAQQHGDEVGPSAAEPC